MHTSLRLAGVSAALVVAAAFASAAPRTMNLPADPLQLLPSPLPGYVKAQGACVTCHSAEYMLYQPPNAGRPYWDAMTKRMKAVFKAPIDDADIPLIVDYLTATYGTKTP